MKYITEEINWKGIGDYVSAARTLSNNGSSNTIGPMIHCQGLALELAFKYFLWETKGTYPITHNLEYLAIKECIGISFTADEISDIKIQNQQYLQDGGYPFPSRYRPSGTRFITSLSQEKIESLITKIISNTKQQGLAERILKR